MVFFQSKTKDIIYLDGVGSDKFHELVEVLDRLRAQLCFVTPVESLDVVLDVFNHHSPVVRRSLVSTIVS